MRGCGSCANWVKFKHDPMHSAVRGRNGLCGFHDWRIGSGGGKRCPSFKRKKYERKTVRVDVMLERPTFPLDFN